MRKPSCFPYLLVGILLALLGGAGALLLAVYLPELSWRSTDLPSAPVPIVKLLDGSSSSLFIEGQDGQVYAWSQAESSWSTAGWPQDPSSYDMWFDRRTGPVVRGPLLPGPVRLELELNYGMADGSQHYRFILAPDGSLKQWMTSRSATAELLLMFICVPAGILVGLLAGALPWFVARRRAKSG